MYSSNSSSYDKFSTSQPPVFSQGTTTTENYTTSQVYSTDDSRSSIELRPKIKGPWSTGLCDCFDDWRNCKFKQEDDHLKNAFLVARYSHALHFRACARVVGVSLPELSIVFFPYSFLAVLQVV